MILMKKFLMFLMSLMKNFNEGNSNEENSNEEN